MLRVAPLSMDDTLSLVVPQCNPILSTSVLRAFFVWLKANFVTSSGCRLEQTTCSVSFACCLCTCCTYCLPCQSPAVSCFPETPSGDVPTRVRWISPSANSLLNAKPLFEAFDSSSSSISADFPRRYYEIIILFPRYPTLHCLIH